MSFAGLGSKNGARHVFMEIGTTDATERDFDEDVVGVGDGRNGGVVTDSYVLLAIDVKSFHFVNL